VAVRSYEGVGKSNRPVRALCQANEGSKVFKVHLMADPPAGRNNGKIMESLLTPSEELVPFPVTLKLDLHILVYRIGSAVDIHLEGMVDNEMYGYLRIDLLRIPLKPGYGRSHGSQIHHTGDSSKILKENPGRVERYFDIFRCFRIIREKFFYIFMGYFPTVFRS
jgi:hypothetical protein